MINSKRIIFYVFAFICGIFFNFFNMILKFIGYTRIYDIHNNEDLTLIYHILKLLNRLGVPIDISYPVVGVCRYIDNRYVRYVCYDHQLTESIMDFDSSDTLRLKSENYHDIVKMEILIKDINDDEIKRIDVTKAKNNFYDLDRSFTNIFDIVKFYLLTNDSKIFASLPIVNKKTILITREKFDDELLEFLKTYDEILCE